MQHLGLTLPFLPSSLSGFQIQIVFIGTKGTRHLLHLISAVFPLSLLHSVTVSLSFDFTPNHPPVSVSSRYYEQI